jgi:aerobic carbon-monoxide dehydrogenase large subunit
VNATIPSVGRFGIGQSAPRAEDARLLTGGGRYAADRTPAAALHAVFVRSPHPHAAIGGVNATAALALPGVAAVLDGNALAQAGVRPLAWAALAKRRDGEAPNPAPRRALALEVARFAGEAVAMALADSPERARDAAEAVEVEWHPRPACADLAQALDAGAPLIVDGAADNGCAHVRLGNAAAVQKAFSEAAHRVALELVNNRLVPNPLEPRTALAVPDNGGVVLYVPSQNPVLMRMHLAQALAVDPARVRIVVEDIGGGFGARFFLYPEYVAIAFAAVRLDRAVKWVGDRSESFLADTHGRDHRTRAELALDPDGRFTALRVRTVANVGAYLSFLGSVIPTVGVRCAPGVYRIPDVDVEVDAVYTHTAPVDAYRGAGRPEAAYVLERLVDLAARQLGLDPAELRRRNLIPPDAIPWTSAAGEVYDSGDFPRILETALTAADWAGFPARRAAARTRGRWRGRGLACFIESTGAANPVETVEVSVDARGEATIISGTQEMGQGIRTGYAQIAAQALELPMEGIRILQGDTAAVATGGGSGGSRSMFIGGSALLDGVSRFLDLARKRAAQALEAATGDLEYGEGAFRVAGTDRVATLAQLAAREPGARLAATTKHRVVAMSWPNGCHACEVEVDPETGAVHIERLVAVDDVGTVVNPMLVHGQVQGGLAQGVGQALLEEARYDAESGQLLTGSFMDYCLPRADDLPSLIVETDETSPCRTNVLGAKGAGEGGAIGAPAAVMNAVLDALAEAGVESLDMPATPQAVWRALRNAKGDDR